MKKVIDLSIGRLKFSLEEDAYERLKRYLSAFEKSIENADERTEVMQDVENRVAEIFQQEQKFSNQVINIEIVQTVINHLGEVEMGEENTKQTYTDTYTIGKKKIYRNTDEKMLAGICSGFGIYLDLDPTIIRIIFVLAVIFAGTGILAYIILWVVIPEANTIVQKLELRGYAPTAENINKFKAEHKYA